MHRTLLTFVMVVILVRLAAAPFARADEPDRHTPTLAAAAARQAQAGAVTQPAPRRPMNLGSKWTGIAMIGTSAPMALSAAIGDCLAREATCRDRRHAVYVAAGVLAGEGAAILTVAHLQRLGPEPDPPRKQMRHGLKWTGIGLLTGSVLAWAGSHQRICYGTARCNDQENFDRTVVTATAAAGAAMLATGFATRHTAWPSVVVAPDRAFVQQRLTF